MLSSGTVELFDAAGRLLAHSFEKRASNRFTSLRRGKIKEALTLPKATPGFSAFAGRLNKIRSSLGMGNMPEAIKDVGAGMRIGETTAGGIRRVRGISEGAATAPRFSPLWGKPKAAPTGPLPTQVPSNLTPGTPAYNALPGYMKVPGGVNPEADRWAATLREPVDVRPPGSHGYSRWDFPRRPEGI